MDRSYDNISNIYDYENDDLSMENSSIGNLSDSSSICSLFCKNETWMSHVKQNRPLIIISIIFILFICILIYLYFSGNLMISF